MNPHPRAQAGAMLGLTAVYLLIEMSFAGRLVDAGSGIATTDTIQVLGQWGHVISGMALFLVVLGTVILPIFERIPARRGRPLVLVALVGLSLAGSMTTAWQGQEWLEGKLIDESSGLTRKVSLMYRVVAIAISKNVDHVEGVDLSSNAPETSVYKLILGVLSFNNPRVVAQLEQRMTHPKILGALEDEPSLTRPDEVAALGRLFTSQCNELKGKYEAGKQKYRDALAAIPATVEDGWRQYVELLAQRGLTPKTAHPYAAKIINILKEKSGLALPANWKPDDQSTFLRAARDQLRTKVETNLAEETKAIFGEPIRPDTPWESVAGHRAVRDYLSSILKFPARLKVSCAMDKEQFKRSAVPAMIAVILTAPAKEFANGGRWEKFGRAAWGGIVIPPVALVFSILGAAMNLGKCLNYASLLVCPAGFRFRKTMLRLILIALVVAPFYALNQVTRSRAFGAQTAFLNTQGIAGHAIAIGARWLINAEHYAYGVNDSIRRNLLGGYKFDSF